MSSLRVLALSFLALLLIHSSATAQHRYFDVDGNDFLDKTKFIFVGRVVDQQSYRSDSPRSLLTRHVFEVKERVKGDPGSRIEITTLGGTVDGVTFSVSHPTQYVLGREYLVFSHVGSQGRNLTLAGPLGRLPVVSSHSGQRRVRIYSSHPLAEVLEGGTLATFQDVGTFASRLRSTLAQSSR